MQKELFENNDFPGKIDKEVLRVKSASSLPLNKSQQQFNKLTKRIASLKSKITEVSQKQRTLQKVYDKDVHPEVVVLGKNKIKLAHLLHEKRQKIKLSKHISEDLDYFIVDLLDDAFYVITASEKDKELYSFYNDTSYEDEVVQQQVNMAQVFSDMIFEQTGIKIDPENLNTENPEAFAKFMAEIEEQKKANEANPKSNRGRKKSQRTLEKENREKQKEALKQKSIRGIYLPLAKILHPDTETDEVLKAEKEEYMKQVTVAYNNKNLPELLELEIRWVNKHENLLSQTPEETLKLYNELLREQVRNLEEELFITESNPAFNNISHIVNLGMSQASGILMNDKKAYIATHQNYAQSIQTLSAGNRDKAIICECLERFYEPEADDFDYQQVLMQMAAGKRRY